MSVPRVKATTTAPKRQSSLLEQIGKAWNDLTAGSTDKVSKLRAPAKPSTDPSKTHKTHKKAPKKTEGPRRHEKKNGLGNAPAQGNSTAPAVPRLCLPSDALPMVIHRFDGAKFQKAEHFGGLVNYRDRTHQVVQKPDIHGKWQVSVQPINEGRINPNQRAFTSNRRLTVADFNDPNSALNQGVVAATKRLNADSNRFSEPTANRIPAKQPPGPHQNLGDWAKQQFKNMAGGASSAVTSTLGMVGSLPEHTVKAASGLADGVQIAANIVSGGRIAPSALNPMLMDNKEKQHNSRTAVSQATDRLQTKVDKTIGADKNSFLYKATEFVAPLLVPTKGAKGGKPSSVRTQGAKSLSPAPLPTVIKGQGLNNIVPFARTGKPPVRGRTGSVPSGGNGRGQGGVQGLSSNSELSVAGSLNGSGLVARLNGQRAGGAATMNAPTRATNGPMPVAAKPSVSPRRPTTSLSNPLAQPRPVKPTAPLAAQPLIPATRPRPQTAQPLGTPTVPAPYQRPEVKALTTRPFADPAPHFPSVAPADLNPADKPQRRGNGDPPIKPGGGTLESEKSVSQWLKKQAARNHSERLSDYGSGRISREAALSRLSSEDRARMNDALNRIDSMRIGGRRYGSGASDASGASGASNGNHSTAGLKEIWRKVDAAGGIDAMPEPSVRQLKGVTEQGLKNTDLTATERAALTKRLESANKAQRQHHKAREPNKNNPPVDTSTWTLPMDQTVLGERKAPRKQPAQAQSAAPNTGMQPSPYLPGESFDDARQRMGTAFNAKDYFTGSSAPRVSPDERTEDPTSPDASAFNSETGTLTRLVKKHGLEGGAPSAEAARVALANEGLYGPTEGVRVIAQWINREQPHLMQDSQGQAGLLGREINQILRSGDKPELPKSLKDLAHSDAVKWPRFNKAEFAKGPSAVVTDASRRLQSSAVDAPRIVEFGPGGGAAVRRLLSDNPNASATLVDVDAANLDRLTQAMPTDMASRVATVTGDASKASLGQGIDLIVAERLLPHLSDADATQLIQNASASLKPGGELIVDFYTTDHFSSKSRNAVYRDAATINKIIGKGFYILARTEQTGLTSLVLVKKPTRDARPD